MQADGTSAIRHGIRAGDSDLPRPGLVHSDPMGSDLLPG